MSLRTSRIVYIPLAVILIGFAFFEAVKYGGIAWAVIGAFAILPDVSLIGADHPDRLKGYLRPERVRFYNLAHTTWFPAALMAASLVPMVFFGAEQRVGLELFWAGQAWMAHIVLDRACGYGPRAADGSIRARPFRGKEDGPVLGPRQGPYREGVSGTPDTRGLPPLDSNQ